MSALWVGAKAAITTETIELFFEGFPCVIARTWLGPLSSDGQFSLVVLYVEYLRGGIVRVVLELGD
jgi:hypothetical protein